MVRVSWFVGSIYTTWENENHPSLKNMKSRAISHSKLYKPWKRFNFCLVNGLILSSLKRLIVNILSELLLLCFSYNDTFSTTRWVFSGMFLLQNVCCASGSGIQIRIASSWLNTKPIKNRFFSSFWSIVEVIILFINHYCINI